MNQKLEFLKTLSFRIWAPVILFVLLVCEAIVLLWYMGGDTTDPTRLHTILGLLALGTVWFLLYEIYVLKKHLFAPFASIKRIINDLKLGNQSDSTHVPLTGVFEEISLGLQEIADRAHDRTLESNIKELEKVVTDLNNSTKLLIQRDLELTRANEKLRDLDKMKSEFVSLATHQLRTPLSGVRWSLSMLLNGEMGELTPEQKLYVMKTYESNNRMITLINDMLQADRVEGGTLKFKFTPTNLSYLFDNVLTELRPIAEKRKIKLNFSIVSDIPPLMIDSENMRIVLQNLIDNAIKYSREGGEVKIDVTKTDTTVLMSVSDQGIGIPQENQANIFKRFFRAPNAVHTETDGSGLGLYIVESIIQRHRGTIRFESTENVGTTFYITLPITMNEKS